MSHSRYVKDALKIALAYADMFEYPLTYTELISYTPVVKLTKQLMDKALFALTGKKRIQPSHLLYLRSRRKLLSVRAQRYQVANKKWNIVCKFIWIFNVFPSIQYMGVTGGLAMNNADEDDDIDLFFIVREKTLWITRIFIIFIVDLIARRRRPNEQDVKNSICLNMFITDQSLRLPLSDRNFYIAHEIIQMQTVLDKNQTYTRFIQANDWIFSFLPNWTYKQQYNSNFKVTLMSRVGIYILRFFEPVARMIQKWYMKRHQTREVVTDALLKFHPIDRRAVIMTQLKMQMNKINIPLDNEIYLSIK